VADLIVFSGCGFLFQERAAQIKEVYLSIGVSYYLTN